MKIPQYFPTPRERDEVAQIRQYMKLWNNDQYAVLGLHDIIKRQYKDEKDIPYIPHPVPQRVSEFYADFVSGDIDLMEISVSSVEGQKLIDDIVYENDLKEKINELAETQSALGYTWVYVWLDDTATINVDEVSPDQVYPQSDGSIIVLSYKLDPSDKEGKRKFGYVQHFGLVGENVIIERSLWKVDDVGVLTSQVDLAMTQTLFGVTVEPISTIEGLGSLPLVKVTNNKKCESDYKIIIPQLAEVNERVTQSTTQFLKNLDAKMQLPKGMADEFGKVAPFDFILVESKEQPEAKYITNGNSLLADVREHIMHELKIIELATGVPLWALTKGTQPDRVESMRIQLFQAVRKTNRKRSRIKRALQDIFKLAFLLKNDSSLDSEDVTLKFSDVLPEDETTITSNESAKVTSGLSSKISSIMRLNKCSEEEAQKELDRIKEEGIGDGVTNPDPLII